MQANDLMTGNLVMVNKDGVCIPKGTIVRVVEVDSANKFPEKGLFGSASCVDVNDRSVSGGIWCEYLSPIPLTPEILEKNGFVPDNFSPYYLPIEDGSIRFSKHQYGLYCNILLPYQRYDGVCNYVHQLQHALRLCGIDKEITL